MNVPLENLFQGNLHQGTPQSPEAQAGHARALLEISDGKTAVIPFIRFSPLSLREIPASVAANIPHHSFSWI